MVLAAAHHQHRLTVGARASSAVIASTVSTNPEARGMELRGLAQLVDVWACKVITTAWPRQGLREAEAVVDRGDVGGVAL